MSQKITGATAVVKSLIEEGVDIIYGYPGGAIMPVYDAFYHFQDEIKHVLTRHEQGATHMAQGYARASGKVGACIATSGPGATNLITGIADAMIDSTPMVCITGQVTEHLLGTDAFQETDVIGISMPITKWNIQVTRAEDIPGAIAKAFYIAKSGRPGPVLVDITKNAQFGELDWKYEKCTGVRSYVPPVKPTQESVEKAAELLNSAKKPYIIFGQGVLLSGAEKELQTLVEKTGIPAAWTILGLSALPTDHPLNVGMVGMHGNYSPNILTNQCDVLLAIGMRFDDRVTGRLEDYATQAKIIHIDIDSAEIGKNVPTDVAIHGDAKAAMEMLIPLVKENSHKEWLSQFHKLDEEEHAQVINGDLYPEKPGLTMGEVIRRINEATGDDALLVTDVGQHQMVAIRYAKFKRPLSNVTSGGLGTMGFCLPAAIGAKMGAPEREVVAVIGDAGFQMTLQELGTILQTGVAVKIVILNNEFLGMVRQWQQLFFDRRYASTEMINPDFITIASGYGVKGEKVTERGDLDAAVKRLIDSKESYLLEVLVEKEGNVFPMIPQGASVAEVRLK
ncbi:MAG: acetolactate synthase, large subunit, biosynthetic type [Flavobacteriaceae bacterium]|nr:MAG: acetolactate synthase, large subunit, biosynthetic type [Flavobacteriaceae bacterium]